MKKLVLLSALLLSLPAIATYTDGVNFFENQQYTQAFAEFKPLADKGDAKSQYYTAYLYLNGFGMSAPDKKKGLEYLTKSTDQGFEKALALLGYLYFRGDGVPLNKKKGIEYYEMAAEGNDSDALLNLGVAYYTGDGVPKDIDKAKEYFEQVDRTKKPVVGLYLGNLYLAGTDDDLKRRVRGLYEVAAVSGEMDAFFALGELYRQGLDGSVPKPDLAAQYHTYAASQGYALSQFALGALYAAGEGMERNLRTAYAWVTIASNSGLPAAAKAQKELESILTLSELDRARRELIEIQRNIIGKVESPLKDYKFIPGTPSDDWKPKKTPKKFVRGRTTKRNVKGGK